jgi:PEGA domain-containing protein
LQPASVSRQRFSAAFLIALSLTAAPTRAQTAVAAPASAGTEKKADAERHFQHGLALARDRNWDAALAEFTASRELYPTRAATRNAAIALAQLRRYAESYEMYEALLHDFAATTPRDQVESWRAEMTGPAAQTAEIAIAASQPQVSVLVDGRLRGFTPLDKPIRVNVGTHTVRFEKIGFEPSESVDTIAGGQRKLLSPRLRQLTDVGVLVVREASGGKLTVLVDGAPAGTTPWTGRIAPGAHHVELRGEGLLGTQPSSATVRGAATTTLVLQAAMLDSKLRVEPIPSNAVVYIDGVAVGTGVWSGRLASGRHRVEVAASGHYTFRRELDLAAERSVSLPAPLERDTSSPIWRSSTRADLSLKLEAGALLAASLNGDAHANHAPVPRGLGAVARFGYGVTHGLTLELSARFVSLWQPLTRDVVRHEQAYTWSSDDYHDTTRLLGGGASLGASYRAFTKYPLTARLAFGAAGLGSRSAVDATFHSSGIARSISIAERGELMLVPFAESEVRVGYRLSERWTLDVGLGLLLFFPPKRVRSAADSPDGVDRPRQAGLAPDASLGALGRITLAEEVLTRSFSVLSPTLGIRYEL